MNEHSRQSPVHWVVIALLVLAIGYPLSFGPACWITSRANFSGKFVTIPYRPIIWLFWNGPQPVRTVIMSYASAGAREGWGWQVKLREGILVTIEWGPSPSRAASAPP